MGGTAADAGPEHWSERAAWTERAMAQDHGATVLHEGLLQRQRFAESELCVEIERNLGEVQVRIERLVKRRDSAMTDAGVGVFEEIDRLLYDIVLDLARLEASEVNLVRLPS